MHALDRRFLGAAIEERARIEGVGQDYIDFAWAIHKANDPNYGPDDFTDGEKAALKRYIERKQANANESEVSH